MLFRSKSGTNIKNVYYFYNQLTEGFSLWEQTPFNDVRFLSVEFVKGTDMKKIVIDKENANKLGYIIEVH